MINFYLQDAFLKPPAAHLLLVTFQSLYSLFLLSSVCSLRFFEGLVTSSVQLYLPV